MRKIGLALIVLLTMLIPAKASALETELALSGDAIAVQGRGVTVEGTVAIITAPGIYRIHGTLDDGRIVVESEGVVELILDGAEISCSTEAPVLVLAAEEVTFNLADGSTNAISDLRAAGDDYDYDAALYFKDAVVVEGLGSLAVVAQANHGIEAKDSLTMNGAAISINCSGNGLHVKDFIRFAGGVVTIEALGDGVKTTNDEEGMGYIEISGGNISIDVAEDGIQAVGDVRIDGGDIAIIAGEDGIQTDGTLEISGGNVAVSTGDGVETEAVASASFDPRNGRKGAASTNEDDTSRKALKADGDISISGGYFELKAQEDGIHANGAVSISGGDFSIRAGDDAVHADAALEISGGNILIEQSYEGLEGYSVRIGNAQVTINSSDDGVNAAGGSDADDEREEFARHGGDSYSAECSVTILEGAKLTIYPQGDGIDANGDLNFEGGETIIWGPTNAGNGSLDAGGEICMNGGTLIAGGAAGMASYPGENSAQSTISISMSETLASYTSVRLEDSNGNTVLESILEENCSLLILSTPELVQGETYTLFAEDEQVATAVAGEYQAGFGGGHGGGPDRGGQFDGGRQPMQQPENAQEGTRI